MTSSAPVPNWRRCCGESLRSWTNTGSRAGAPGQGGAHQDEAGILDWGINVRGAQGGGEIRVELTVVLDGKKGAGGSGWKFSSAEGGTQFWRSQSGGTL